MTPEQWSRLPQYAQREFEALRRHVDALSEVAEGRIKMSKAVVWKDSLTAPSVPVSGPLTSLRYSRNPERGGLEVSFIEEGAIEVRGWSAIGVWPQASNVAQIRLER